MSSFSVLNSVILTENEELHRCVPLSTQHHIFQVWFNMSRHTPVVVPCDLDGTLWNNVNPDDFPPPQFWQSGGRHESSWGFTYWGVDWFIHIIYSYFIHIFIHIYINPYLSISFLGVQWCWFNLFKPWCQWNCRTFCYGRFNVCYHTFEWSSLKLIALAAYLGDDKDGLTFGWRYGWKPMTIWMTTCMFSSNGSFHVLPSWDRNRCSGPSFHIARFDSTGLNHVESAWLLNPQIDRVNRSDALSHPIRIG